MLLKTKASSRTEIPTFKAPQHLQRFRWRFWFFIC